MEKCNKKSNTNTSDVLIPDNIKQKEISEEQAHLGTIELRRPNETWDKYAARVLRSSWWIW